MLIGAIGLFLVKDKEPLRNLRKIIRRLFGIISLVGIFFLLSAVDAMQARIDSTPPQWKESKSSPTE